MDIFERIHPEAIALFLFDNAPSHRKMADDALNVDKMNVGPGRKQPNMRDAIWGGAVQRMIDNMGTPKGMHLCSLARHYSPLQKPAQKMSG